MSEVRAGWGVAGEPEPLRIVSIGGASRSGSTLLTLLLAVEPSTVPVGELRYLWSRGLQQNMLCGCGIPLRDCTFWRDVLDDAFGGLEAVDAVRMQRLHDRVAAMGRLPLLLSPVMPRGFRRDVETYVDALSRLCRSIARVSGATTLVDASKLPTFCWMLGRVPDATIDIVHLVRDSRAVAFSFGRMKVKPDVHWERAYMRRFGPVRSAFDWMALNVGIEAVRRSGIPTTFVRYEDLANDPGATVAPISRRAADAVSASLPTGSIPLRTTHTVSGNPLRFSRGALSISPDGEWRHRMRARDREIVTAMTWPLLARYGYPTIDAAAGR